MKYFLFKGFKESLQQLIQWGASNRIAGEKTKQLIADISLNGKELDYDPFLAYHVTNHGESRIKHCVKYDVGDAHRIITIKDNGICAICFVGKHSDCDKWLDANNGLKLSVNNKNQLEPMYESEDIELPEKRITGISDYSGGKLYAKLSARYYDQIAKDVNRTILLEFEKLSSIVEDEEIMELACKIEENEKQNMFYDVFVLLKNSKIDEAKKRIDLYKSERALIENMTEEELIQITEGDGVIDLSNFDSELIQHLMQTMNYQQWMLFMHPDQSAIVDEDFSGPAKVKGVSGSGKTAIVVRRAVRLAKKYKNNKILILTLNRALAKLINELVTVVCPSDYRNDIIVKSFWELCLDLLLEYEPQNKKIYQEITWKTKENIDEIWEEYYNCRNNNNDASVLMPVHHSLMSRSVYPFEYLKQEMDWIRSALHPNERDEYLTIERKGRTEPFDREYREFILTGLRSWEQKMSDIGVIDYLGLTTALMKHYESLTTRFRCVLIDEEQDFGTIELSIIRRLVSLGENDIFLTGDFAQRVSIKHRVYTKANIILGSRIKKIIKNYRNSREILDAAFNVLSSNVDIKSIKDEDLELLRPEYADLSTNKPLLMNSDSLDLEIASAIEYLNGKLGENQKGCIAICGASLTYVKNIGQILKIDVLDGTTSISNSKVFLSDLEQTKGFEFDSVCIVNCTKGIIPNESLPKEEMYFDVCKLYVAMTRAKLEMIISYSGQLSDIFNASSEYFLLSSWHEHVKVKNIATLPPIWEVNSPVDRYVLNMTGKEFVYSKNAMGVSRELQEKMLLHITGVSKSIDGKDVEWKSIKEVLFERNQANIAQLFGAQKTYKEFMDLFGR